MKTIFIDYDEIKHDTGDGGATLFLIDKNEVWIPNSLIEDVWDDENQVEVARWFAEQEDLI